MGRRNLNVTDSLVQLGGDFKKTQDHIQHVSRRFEENLPIVEKSLDRVGTLYTFKMEFLTYTDRPQVILDIRFLPKFISPFYEEA
jgi:hypothetical protein